MRRLTDDQAEALFELMQGTKNCPEWYFSDVVKPSTCPRTPDGLNDCPRCIKTGISRLRVADEHEDRYERMQ